MNQKNGNIIEKPVVNDVEDIKTVTYFQNKPISQQWFMVMSHGQFPMFNAPKNRSKRLDELKSIAKSVQMNQERKYLMMKITNNDHDDGSLELKFYSEKENIFQYSVDCRKIDLFKKSKKDRTFFYFTLLPHNDHDQRFECQIYHAIGVSNAEFISNLMEKQVELNLKELKSKNKLSSKVKKTVPQIYPNVEKARQFDREHPFDESLDETASTVPTLLDLELEKVNKSNTSNSTADFKLLNSDLDYIPKCPNNPFSCDWKSKPDIEATVDQAIYRVTIQPFKQDNPNNKFEDNFQTFDPWDQI